MDAATIEETNRLRVSLGMKPLPVPGAENDANSEEEEDVDTLESRQAQGYENYRKLQEAEATKKRREERVAAIRKARDQAQRFAKLEGKGLGEEDEKVDVDAKSWLLGQKKRQKKIEKARKLEEELAAAEAEAAAAVQYTSKDLAGIKVAHDTSAFLDGDEQILTLKDSTIGQDDESGDELENFDLREKEKLEDRIGLKKRKPGYNPLDDEEGERGILSHYDEEIEGKKSKKFTLDQDGAIGELSAIMEQPTQDSRKLQSVSLDDIVGKSIASELRSQRPLLTPSNAGNDAAPSSDYLAASEVKVKKPKKKKNKGTRQKQVDEDDIFPIEQTNGNDGSMDIDSKDAAPKKKRKNLDEDFVDDDDLQASLAAQRRNALKKRKKMRPEDIAKQLREQADDEQPAGGEQEGGLVIGEISEFVAGLSKPEEEEEERRPRKRRTTTRSPERDEDEDMADINHNYNPTQDESDLLQQAQQQEEASTAIVDEEKTVGEGMGAALALLRERGLVTDSSSSAFQAHRDREDFLLKKRLLEAELDEQTRQQRERDRRSGKLDRMSQRDREEYARQENHRRDLLQSRRLAELFAKTYKPNVEIKYHDENGRELDRKEAFKEMSHQFHGKGSGKGKTEKMLKKIEDEKRREGQSLFDAGGASGGGMSAAAQQQVKKRREAGVRLQ
jgi:U4/U6.U5 tri-snRNP-associated protein 1